MQAMSVKALMEVNAYNMNVHAVTLRDAQCMVLQGQHECDLGVGENPAAAESAFCSKCAVPSKPAP